ncbi:ATP-dependent Clp protease proteolytic subunit [Rouxiella sp. Mn2063]|uniref:ATP-dependent Clp protease proteolytic subunit n=1 Tax=Rouxiella sp. Mn2063 TaxID=3395262 RepID=UPI003BC935E8
MKSKLCLLTLGLFSLFLSAGAQSVESEGKDRVAKIYYTGDMQTSTVIKLVSVIDEINKNNNVDNIYLYINSYGGDMDAGLMASAAIKSSKIPVTAIAMSTVGSSATIMFCAAKDRRSLPDGSIYLHPAFTSHNGDLRPADITYLGKENKRFNEMFKKTYRECTKLDENKINDILNSEYNRETFSPEKAIGAGLISKVDEKIVDANYNYYVTSKDDG